MGPGQPSGFPWDEGCSLRENMILFVFVVSELFWAGDNLPRRVERKYQVRALSPSSQQHPQLLRIAVTTCLSALDLAGCCYWRPEARHSAPC